MKIVTTTTMALTDGNATGRIQIGMFSPGVGDVIVTMCIRFRGGRASIRFESNQKTAPVQFQVVINGDYSIASTDINMVNGLANFHPGRVVMEASTATITVTHEYSTTD